MQGQPGDLSLGSSPERVSSLTFFLLAFSCLGKFVQQAQCLHLLLNPPNTNLPFHNMSQQQKSLEPSCT